MNNMPSTSRFVYTEMGTSLQLDNPRFMKSIDYTTLPVYQELVSSFDLDNFQDYLTKYNQCISNDEFELSIFNARKYNYPLNMIQNMVDAVEDQVDDYISSLSTYLDVHGKVTDSSQDVEDAFIEARMSVRAIDCTKTADTGRIIISKDNFYSNSTYSYSMGTNKTIRLVGNNELHCCDIYFDYTPSIDFSDDTLCVVSFKPLSIVNNLPFYVDTQLDLLGNPYIRLQIQGNANAIDDSVVNDDPATDTHEGTQLWLQGIVFKEAS